METTTSNKSRAVIHYQRRNSAGNLVHKAACHSTGKRLVGIRFFNAIACESCKRIAEEDRAVELGEIIVSMDLRSKVIATYDNAQTAGCETATYIELAQSGNEDQADHFVHQQAIGKVFALLVKENVITSDTPERIVNLAYTEIT